MAALTAADIAATFPEFDLRDDANVPIAAQLTLIGLKLAEAEGQVDRTVFQKAVNADTVVKYLTAHLLAISPSGIAARLSKDGKQSIYWDTFERLAQAATCLGFRVP